MTTAIRRQAYLRQRIHALPGGSVVRDGALYEVTVWINRLEKPLLTATYVVLLAYVLFGPRVLLGYEREHLLRDAR